MPATDTLRGFSDETYRAFLAVRLDDVTRHALATQIDVALAEGSGGRMPGRPVPVPNWHLTLRFLGDVSTPTTERILSHLDQHLVSVPFRLRFDRLGAFPRPRKASVLWLGVSSGAAALAALAAEVEAAVVAAGLPPEDRPFHPHVTLSRIRPPWDITTLLEMAELSSVAMQVEAVTLYRSHLGPGGATYEVLDEVPLDETIDRPGKP